MGLPGPSLSHSKCSSFVLGAWQGRKKKSNNNTTPIIMFRTCDGIIIRVTRAARAAAAAAAPPRARYKRIASLTRASPLRVFEESESAVAEVAVKPKSKQRLRRRWSAGAEEVPIRRRAGSSSKSREHEFQSSVAHCGRRAFSSLELLSHRSVRGGRFGTMASSEAAVSAESGGEVGAKVEQDAGTEKGEEVLQNGGDKSEDAAAAAAIDRESGFTRPEMCSESLVGTVNFYERHIFLCYKDAEAWPGSVESGNFDPLPRTLVAALKTRKTDIAKKTRMTLCGVSEQTSPGDVLVFPEMRQYKSLTPDDVESFVDSVLVHEKEWTDAKPVSLSGSQIFICAHGARDKRCGVCGPALIERFEEEVKARGLEKDILIRSCSHIGGHKYAGNVIVFSESGPFAGSGHWYGYVALDDVATILDQHIGKGEIIDRLWRGEMGLNKDVQKETQQSRLPGQEKSNGPDHVTNGISKDKGVPNADAAKEIQKPEKVSHSADPTAHDGHLVFLEDEPDEEPAGPRIKLWGSYYIPLPKFVEKWEREDTHAALAVVGAAAAVAVAVRVYRKSKESSS